MRLKNTVALNENGNLKPAVRKTLVKYVTNHRDIFAKAEQVEDKAVFTLPVTDTEGNVVYVTFDVSVSTKNPADRKAKTAKTAKADTAPVEVE